MIHFFRRIRQKLLSENRITRYLIYAIGEIALVMIGILLALQVNNWNEHRIALQHETKVVSELSKELDQNLIYLNSEIAYTKNRISALRDLLELTSSEIHDISYEDFNKLYSTASGFQEFIPIYFKVSEILNREDFIFTQSDQLHNALLVYSSHIKKAHEYYQYNVDTYKTMHQPYLITEYPLRDFSWLPEEVRGSRHSIDHLALLKSRKFESLLANIYADVYLYQKELAANVLDIKALQEIIRNDYKIKAND